MSLTAAEVLADMRKSGKLGISAADAVAAMRKSEAAIQQFGRVLVPAMRRFASAFPTLAVDDPFEWRPVTLAGWAGQAKAIMLHEFWCAAGRPERSPGARWVWPKGKR